MIHEEIAKLHFGPNPRFCRRTRLHRKLPILIEYVNLPCNQSDSKIIEFGLQSEFCNFLKPLFCPYGEFE